MFFACFFNCFCIVNYGESLGIMVSFLHPRNEISISLILAQFNTLFSHTGFAVNIASVFLSLAQIMSGVMVINMPTALQGFNYLSPLRYALRNLAPYSLRDILFTCNNLQRLPNGRCIIETGKDVLDLYDLDTNPELNLIGLAACVVIYRALAYVLLKMKKTHWGGRKGQNGVAQNV